MALEDGAPQLAAPELFPTLTPWERSLADRAFQQRLSYRGLGDPELRDDEPPAAVAAWCIRRAATRAATRVALAAVVAFFAAAVVNQLQEIPQPWARIFAISCLSVASLSGLVRAVRGVQVRRFLATHPAPPPSTEPWVDREPAQPIGPYELAPVLMRRLTRPEAAFVRDVFPGTGAMALGRPRWDGSPGDRVILRRALRFEAWLLVLLLLGICGSLLADVALSGVLGLLGKGPEDGITGVFVAGWIGGGVLFVRRRLQIRRWYRAGVGREAELARKVAGTPPDPAARPVGPSAWRGEPSGRAKILLTLATDALLVGMAAFLVQGGLAKRAESSPVDGGVTTTGTVVKVERYEGSRGGDTYRTRVRFSDKAGQTFTIRGTQGEERARQGQNVQVSYDPNHPEDGHDITTNTSAWKWPFFSGMFPAVIALVSLISLGVMMARGSVRWRKELQD